MPYSGKLSWGYFDDIMTSSYTHSAWHQNWHVKVEKPVLPSSSTRAYSSLTKKDLDNTNKDVKCALEVRENEKVATPWGGLKRNCQPQTAPLSIKLANFSPTSTSCHVWPALDYIIPLITSCIFGLYACTRRSPNLKFANSFWRLIRQI